MTTPLDQITRMLRGFHMRGSFVTQSTVPTSDLTLAVKDAGPVPLPLTAAAARALCSHGQPARHGYKEETRLDLTVRDTWEIPASRVVIDEPRWARTLGPALARVRAELGLPEECTLAAALHNLLIYEPGQFFRPHQDSEKGPSMIGTLVVILPSQFSGGELVIEHLGRRRVIRGSPADLTLAAFYADCQHQVRPVKKGFRAALTYNLFVQGAPAVTPAGDRLDALTREVGLFLEQDIWREGEPPSPPAQLAFLLHHQYTQAGLRWEDLKGRDAASVAALREAGRRLGCRVYLAMADTHERWDGPLDLQIEPEEDEDLTATPEPPAGMLERGSPHGCSVELHHFIGPSPPPADLTITVEPEELCDPVDSRRLNPWNSRYEPYMGNSGNTLDRWYHRVALVLWPPDRAFLIQAKASPLWAMDEIGRVLESEGPAAAVAQTERLLPIWGLEPEDQNEDEERRVLAAAVRLAARLGEPAVAASLLAPCRLHSVTPACAADAAALLPRYGQPWFQELLRVWMAVPMTHFGPAGWDWDAVCPAIAPLCEALGKLEGGALAIRQILTASTQRLRQELLSDEEKISPRVLPGQLAQHGRAFLILIETAAIHRETKLQEQLVSLLAAGEEVRLPAMLAALRHARERHGGEALQFLHLAVVHARARQHLAQQPVAPVLPAGDWSLHARVRCPCPLCAMVTRYLRAPDQIWFEQPLAEKDGRHVWDQIRSECLPVRLLPQDQNPLEILLLEKQPELFEEQAAARETAAADLQWLESVAGDF